MRACVRVIVIYESQQLGGLDTILPVARRKNVHEIFFHVSKVSNVEQVTSAGTETNDTRFASHNHITSTFRSVT